MIYIKSRHKVRNKNLAEKLFLIPKSRNQALRVKPQLKKDLQAVNKTCQRTAKLFVVGFLQTELHEVKVMLVKVN